MELIQKVKKNILQGKYFDRGDTVIIGVSGGPDSTALAYILDSLRYELGLHLYIAHYNHHLRRSADGDQKFVEQLARQLKAPYTIGRWHKPSLRHKGSLEEAARRRRFHFFNQLARKIKAKAVVLAHTKDDQAETVLMRILRGTGLQGLRGMLVSRKINEILCVRPLLNISKDEILAFLKKEKISFRLDPTNKRKIFTRNKIRLELLPYLAKHYNRGIKDLLANLGDNAITDYGYLEREARKIYAQIATSTRTKAKIMLSLPAMTRQHPAIQRMIVRLGLETLQGNTNRFTLIHLREIEDLIHQRPPGAIVHLPENIQARKNLKHLILTRN